MTSTAEPRTPDVAPPRPAALHVVGLTKTFGRTRVLDLDELDIRAGEFHALVGQNGSGKSTLIKILAGFHQPDGSVSAQSSGVDIHLGGPATAHQAGFRFVHQDLGLVGVLDTVDNLALGVGYTSTSVGRIRWRREAERARGLIERLGYSFDVRLPVQKLAPAQRTAVAVARALGELDQDISLLVMDEPTATMPKPEVERLLALARRVTERGIAVLYVSHHLDEVLTAADRVTVLRDGARVATARVPDVTGRILVDLMTGSVDDRAARRAGTADADAPVVLAVRGLGGRRLRDFDLDLHAGEIVGVGGISGSGREELSALLFGGTKRTGSVRVGDVELRPRDPAHAVKQRIGYVPANRLTDGVIASMTVRENVTLADLSLFRRWGRLRHRPERKEVARLRSEFRIVGGSDDRPVARLSGGNQQKASIAKWMRLGPRILLLDEPTQGVDVAAQAEIHRLVDEAAAHGTAVLVCSSDEAELARLCSRVVILREGRIAATFTADEITPAALVRASQVAAAADEGEPA